MSIEDVIKKVEAKETLSAEELSLFLGQVNQEMLDLKENHPEQYLELLKMLNGFFEK